MNGKRLIFALLCLIGLSGCGQTSGAPALCQWEAGPAGSAGIYDG